jgi:hypothetical protein
LLTVAFIVRSQCCVRYFEIVIRYLYFYFAEKVIRYRYISRFWKSNTLRYKLREKVTRYFSVTFPLLSRTVCRKIARKSNALLFRYLPAQFAGNIHILFRLTNQCKEVAPHGVRLQTSFGRTLGFENVTPPKKCNVCVTGALKCNRPPRYK